MIHKYVCVYKIGYVLILFMHTSQSVNRTVGLTPFFYWPRIESTRQHSYLILIDAAWEYVAGRSTVQ